MCWSGTFADDLQVCRIARLLTISFKLRDFVAQKRYTVRSSILMLPIELFWYLSVR